MPGPARTKVKETMDSIDLDGANSTDVFSGLDFPSIFIQVVYTGATGTPEVKLQVSGDNTNWDDVAGYASAALAGAGSFSWQLKDFSAPFYKILVSSAGTAGSAIVIFSGNR